MTNSLEAAASHQTDAIIHAGDSSVAGHGSTHAGDNLGEYRLDLMPVQVNSEKGQVLAADGSLTVTPAFKQDGPQYSPDRSVAQTDILFNASQDLGQQIWRQSKFASITDQGKLGAAAAVSAVLQQARFDVDSATVSGLADKLKDIGFTQGDLSEAKPGDIVITDNGSSTTHKNIAIVADDGKHLYDSSSLDGVWKLVPFRTDRKGSVLHPPDTCDD